MPLYRRDWTRGLCAPGSSSIHCSKAYRILWQLLIEAFGYGQATREVANPVLWVRGANLRYELITQADGGWQETRLPYLPNPTAHLLEPSHTQIQEDPRNGKDR